MSNKEKKTWKILDLFSGAGGLSNGFEQTGNFEVIAAVENNIAAAETYILNHGNNRDIIIMAENGEPCDITDIEFEEILINRGAEPSDTIVLGGPPCQGFSNANRQKNHLISGNNLLVIEFARAIYQVQPAAFLMENVKTMTSEAHKFFVQKNTDENLDVWTPSRRRAHLEWLNQEKTVIQLNQYEQLTIAKIGEDGLLPEWANYIHDNYENLDLLFKDKESVSLLRSLERRARKKSSYIPIASTRKKIQKLIEEMLLSDHLPWKEEVIIAEKNIFSKLATGELIELNNYHRTLKRLINLNNAIANIQELKINQIEFNNLSLDKEKREIKVNVTTYNVVEYLEAYFEKLGYKLNKNVLTASNFGVPQKRNRFFILGVNADNIKTKNSNGEKEVKLPIQNIEPVYKVFDAIADLENIEPSTDISKYEDVYKPKINSSPLLNYYRGEMKEEEKDIIFNHVNTESREQIKLRYEAIKERGGKNSKDVQDLFKEGYSKLENIQNTVYLRLDYEQPSPTVVNVRKSMWSHPEKARAISIREAARLQSFRDDFKFTGKKDNQYQQIGNAVPPLLARGIAEELLKILGEKPMKPIKDELNKLLVST